MGLKRKGVGGGFGNNKQELGLEEVNEIKDGGKKGPVHYLKRCETMKRTVDPGIVYKFSELDNTLEIGGAECEEEPKSEIRSLLKNFLG